MPCSGCRAGGPPDRAAAEEREEEDVGVAVGARLGGIVQGVLLNTGLVGRVSFGGVMEYQWDWSNCGRVRVEEALEKTYWRYS